MKSNKKIFAHVSVQMKEIVKISNIMNRGLSDRLQLKMKLNAQKRGREIIKCLTKQGLQMDWLEENFGISIEEMKDMINQL